MPVETQSHESSAEQPQPEAKRSFGEVMEKDGKAYVTTGYDERRSRNIAHEATPDILERVAHMRASALNTAAESGQGALTLQEVQDQNPRSAQIVVHRGEVSLYQGRNGADGGVILAPATPENIRTQVIAEQSRAQAEVSRINEKTRKLERDRADESSSIALELANLTLAERKPGADLEAIRARRADLIERQASLG